MVFENVVVAYDGSDQALAAVKKAAEIVGGEEAAMLHVVFVTTHPMPQLPQTSTALRLTLSSTCFPLKTSWRFTTRPLMRKPKRLRKALAMRSIPWA